MPNLLETFPLDIIQYEICPYLDYNTRVALNLLLPYEDRRPTPLKKHAAIDVALLIAISMIRGHLNAVDRRKGLGRNRALLKFYREFPKYYFLLQYNTGFREAALEKSRQYANPENPDYTIKSKYFKDTLVGLSKKMIEDVERDYPFIEHITTLRNDAWSAITNSTHVTVDNSEQVNEYLESQPILQQHAYANNYYSSDDD